MGVVLSFVGGWGHAEPLLPVARLAASIGHHVTFAGQSAVVPRLADLGFDTVTVGPDTLSAQRHPLVPVDRESERTVMREHFFARYGALRAAELGNVLRQAAPDLVVCDEVDVGAQIAADCLRIPCVTVSVIAAGLLTSPAVVAQAWDRLRVDHGLPADPTAQRLGGDLVLSPAPRSFRDPTVPVPDSFRPVRPTILDGKMPRLEPPERPFVYATLGTVFNVESGDLLVRLVHALGVLDVDALVTVGPSIDPDEFDGVGGNVQVEQFVDQHDVLGRCSAVVCHGGSGTVISALSLGLPVVVLPMGADQPDNADRCRDLGVGIVLDALTADVGSIARAVDDVVHHRPYHLAAAELGAEAARQPTIDRLQDLLRLLDR